VHTRPVVVLALSAATGAGLILARSHQRRARNGNAAVAGEAAHEAPPPAGRRPEPQPEPFRIEARTVAAPRGEPARNGSTPSTSAPRAPLGPVELPQERISSATLIAVAAALAVCAVALGAWAYGSRDGSSSASYDAEALSVLSSPGALRVPFAHSAGRLALVVEPGGRAVLVLDGLREAPSGRAYQAWVVRRGEPAGSAALFGGDERVVTLSLPVPRGDAVAVTIERSGGAAVPSRDATLVARRA